MTNQTQRISRRGFGRLATGAAVAATAYTQLAASGRIAQAASHRQAGATLRYPSWMLAEAGVGEYWKASVEAFQQQNAGVTLQTTLIPSNQYEDKTLIDLAAGQAPDIYPVFTNMMPRLMDEDVLEPLDGYLAQMPWNNGVIEVRQQRLRWKCR